MSDKVKNRLYERYGIVASDRFVGELSYKCAASDGRLIVIRNGVEVWKIDGILCVFDRHSLTLRTVLPI